MTPSIEKDQRRIDDMLDKLRDIRVHLRIGWEVFSRDKDLQKVVAYDLLIVGEAASRVSRSTQRRNPRVPWVRLAKYRNQLIHEYGELDLKETWAFAQDELRNLERHLSRVRLSAENDAE